MKLTFTGISETFGTVTSFFFEIGVHVGVQRFLWFSWKQQHES